MNKGSLPGSARRPFIAGRGPVVPTAGSILTYDPDSVGYREQPHPTWGPPSATAGTGNGIMPAMVGYAGFECSTAANEVATVSSPVRISEDTAVNGFSCRVTTAIATLTWIIGIYRAPLTADPTTSVGFGSLYHETPGTLSFATIGTKTLFTTAFHADQRLLLTPGWYRILWWPSENTPGSALAGALPLPLVGQRRSSGGSYPPSGTTRLRIFGGSGGAGTLPANLNGAAAISTADSASCPWFGLYRRA